MISGIPCDFPMQIKYNYYLTSITDWNCLKLKAPIVKSIRWNVRHINHNSTTF